MKIAYITSELYPIAEDTKYGFGECIYFLSKYLVNAGQEVSIFMPLYDIIDNAAFNIEQTDLKTWVNVKEEQVEFDIYSTSLNGVTVYFLSNSLFQRNGFYDISGESYSDNDIRFSAFCRGCLNFIAYHTPDMDIIHSFGWQAALVPVYNKKKYLSSNWKTVFTVHDVSKQGIFTKFSIENIGLPWEMYTMEELEFYDNINFMKGAILHCDAIIATSAIQAESFLSSSSAFRLQGVFSRNLEKLAVIEDGLDEKWSPDKGTWIRNYTADNFNNKAVNKHDFCNKFDLDPSLPLFSIGTKHIKRFSISSINDVVPAMENLQMNIFVYGEGKQAHINEIKQLNVTNVRIVTEENEKLEHELLAASDFMFIPYLNPARVTLLKLAKRYGVIPVLKNLPETPPEDDMFTYNNIKDLRDTLIKCIEFYHDIPARQKYMQKLMRTDSSWESAAVKYETLYKTLL